MTEDLEIKKCNKVLQVGKLILYPTDTVWGIGCDATNELAVKKVFEIKKRDESKSLVILVDSFQMLENYVNNIPIEAVKLLKKSTRPTTIIYNNPKGLAKNVIADDNTVAIRIVQEQFCQKLINEFGKPIVSTSANISNKPTPKSFKEIELSILGTVDYIVNLKQNEITNSPSKIVRITSNGELEIIRE
jgi:L-threonylcarbamoyladenylate synthase